MAEELLEVVAMTADNITCLVLNFSFRVGLDGEDETCG